MSINKKLDTENRSYFWKNLVKNTPAIAFVALIIIILTAKAPYLRSMEIIEQKMVLGMLVHSSAMETNTGSVPIWTVTLDTDNKDVIVSASEKQPFRKGKKVKLVEYVYENGSRKYGFYEYVD